VADDRGEWLRREAARWVAEGLLSAEQAEAILARHAGAAAAEGAPAGPAPAGIDAAALDERVREKGLRQGRVVAVVSTLAVVLIGIGAILFFAANWAEMPRWGKLAVVFAPLAGSFLLAWRLRFSPGEHPAIGEALLLLGAILYGSAIFLVAQIFHIRAHWPNGVLWWWLGALVLAYAALSRSALVLALLLVPVWVGCESVFWFDREKDEAVWLLVLLMFLAAGTIYLAAGRIHRRLRGAPPFAGAFEALGSVVLLAWAYVLSFGWFHHEMGAAVTEAPLALRWAIGLGAVALGATAAAAWLRPAADALLDALVPFALLAVGLLLAAFPAGHVWPILFNFVLLALIVWMVRLGMRAGRSWPVNLAVAFFVLLVATRYFDSFWNLMPRALFFLLGGILLLGGGIALERQRRRLLGRARKAGP